MNAIATTNPDTDPALQKRLVDKRRRESHGWFGRRDRERVVELTSTIAFLVTAVLIAVLADSSRSLDPALAIALVATYAISARVEFDTGAGYVRPTEPILVVMLFLLPLPTVPLFVAAGVLLARVPRYLRREIEPERVIVGVGDAWHAVGPTLVLIAAGTTTPEWSEWPVYAAALAAQFAVDFVNVLRASIALGIPFRALIDELRTVYLVDLLLAPIGLLAAFACVDEQWAFLALLPLIGLIKIFARERDARIENALTLSAAYRGTAHLLGEVLSTNHEYTGTHSRSVVVIAHQVGEALELDEVTMREIEFGALLHDVGKMAIPNEILNKPAKLTDAEMELVRAHTVEGAEMLNKIGGVLAEVGEVVRSHHEHWDGGGYPRGLAGEEIPIAARVISCCDAFSAMTTDRPYRAAMSLDEAIVELRANAGTQFDPEVVIALIGIIETWQASVEVPTTDSVTA
jgi:putative nucleotidyltransferase with HDIG domain